MVIADHAVRAAAEEGCTQFNMLRGSEHYKRALGGQEHALASATVVRRHSATALAVRTRARGQGVWRRLPETQRERLRGLFQRPDARPGLTRRRAAQAGTRSA